MFIRLLLLFTLVPIMELYILFSLGERFGFFTSLIIVLGTGALGAYLAKSQGLIVWQKIQGELSQGRLPKNDLIDGLLLLIAGIVLITPGLLTDLAGFLILFPGTRMLIRIWIIKKLQTMTKNGNINISGLMR